jgi:flagellar basal-body rod protein FlgG
VEPELLGQFGLRALSTKGARGGRVEPVSRNRGLGRARSREPPGLDGLGTFRQGYLEDSSVDAVREITELIEAQRGYELNAKVITAADQMLARRRRSDDVARLSCPLPASPR